MKIFIVLLMSLTFFGCSSFAPKQTYKTANKPNRSSRSIASNTSKDDLAGQLIVAAAKMSSIRLADGACGTGDDEGDIYQSDVVGILAEAAKFTEGGLENHP